LDAGGSSHEPGEAHDYLPLVCRICGQPGQVVVSIERWVSVRRSDFRRSIGLNWCRGRAGPGTDGRVEQAAIAIARRYAAANGYDPEDRTAVGLVLAGMAIAARASASAQVRIAEGYIRFWPETEQAINGWAEQLTAATRPEPHGG
jgi:hypothetical protein